MMPPRIFDRAAYAKRRARADHASAESFLIEDVTQALQERISTARRHFGRGLDIGSRRQSFALLTPVAKGWVRTSLWQPELPIAGRDVVADEEYLPFADAAFDIATSVLALHAVNDLPGALVQIRRLLRPGGLFVAAMFGTATLNELRRAFAAGEMDILGGVSPRVAPFAEVRDLGGLLQRAGFALPVADLERTNVRYRDFFTLIADLRTLGETNVLVQRSRQPLKRSILSSAIHHYIQNDSEPDGRLKATFDIVYLTGWAPGTG
ncbi:MAG: methyltransferase domain-containing protein [Rhizomicrobium sp.]|jgi:SAM-dependent methyltransferase